VSRNYGHVTNSPCWITRIIRNTRNPFLNHSTLYNTRNNFNKISVYSDFFLSFFVEKFVMPSLPPSSSQSFVHWTKGHLVRDECGVEEKEERRGYIVGQASPTLLVASLAGAILFRNSFCLWHINNEVTDHVTSSTLKKASRLKVESWKDFFFGIYCK
jgi:hypothetical protein